MEGLMARWGHKGNPEIYLPRMRAYYQANKEKWNTPEHKAKDKAWREANTERRLEQGTARRKAARKYIGEIKQQPCEDCGLSFPWYVMDLDHVRGDKNLIHHLGMLPGAGRSLVNDRLAHAIKERPQRL
jgi:hypothetical protein